jgi:hypothetical protein
MKISLPKPKTAPIALGKTAKATVEDLLNLLREVLQADLKWELGDDLHARIEKACGLYENIPPWSSEWESFLERCKAKLLSQIPPDDYWAWWRYGVDNSWIIPSGESLADADAITMFAGASSREQVAQMVLVMRQTVEAFKESCSVELRNELLRAAVPMP